MLVTREDWGGLTNLIKISRRIKYEVEHGSYDRATRLTEAVAPYAASLGMSSFTIREISEMPERLPLWFWTETKLRQYPQRKEQC